MLSFSTLHITNHQKKKKKFTEFINYQTKNNTTQPKNKNHVRIRKLTQKKKLGNEPKEVDIGLGNLGNFTPRSYGEQ